MPTPPSLRLFGSDQSDLGPLSIAKNSWQRIKGLLGTPKPATDQWLIIPGCDSVHTWGMTYPIDVVFLRTVRTSEGMTAPGAWWEILKVVPAVRPWRAFFPVKGADAVLEGPAGAAERASLKPGDIVRGLTGL